MGRTFTQLRQLTAQQLGLTYITGTIASSGNSTTTFKDTNLSVYPNDRLDGYWVLLTSGSPSATELLVTSFTSSTGVATFTPTLGAAPDSLTYELSPFNGTDYLRAMQDATLILYDNGLLVRQFPVRLMSGSPIYNADWSYWTSTSTVDGWTVLTTTVSKPVSTAIKIMDIEQPLQFSGAGSLTLDPYWRRYLADFRNQTVTLYCLTWASTGSAARINLSVDGTNNYSPYNGGTGTAELLSVQVSLGATAYNIVPTLLNDGAGNVQFGMPFIVGGAATSYPFPVSIMPDGPSSLTLKPTSIDKDAIASGRGKMTLKQFSRDIEVSDWSWYRLHVENSTNMYGIVGSDNDQRMMEPGYIIRAEGEGPLTLPTSNLDTTTFEVTQSESLLLATLTAIKLLERLLPRAPFTLQQQYNQRIGRLQQQYNELVKGVGPTRSSSSLPLKW